MNVGSLFSGIGGFDLGLERAGMRTVWFCEQDEFCQHVLAKHWPGVPCYPDITELRGADVEPVDVLCGGFPCQDLSKAGRRAGIDGARSGLWGQYARLIGELRPRYVLVENVADLLARGLGRVLGDLAALGYDAEWDCIPAASVGAPHLRDRLWLVAYPNGVARATGGTCEGRPGAMVEPRPLKRALGRGCGEHGQADEGRTVDDALCGRHGASPATLRAGRDGFEHAGWWLTEPDVGRVAHGVPARVDRLRSLGNALVPQIAEWIGGRVMAYENALLEDVAA